MEKVKYEVNNSKINKVLDWMLYIFGYTLVLYLADLLFNSLYSENIFYDLLAAIIISILNKTIKPLIFRLTISITAITLGLFYPFINLFILKIVDFILGDNFNIYGIFYGILIAIMISIMNILVEGLIIKPIIRRGNKNE